MARRKKGDRAAEEHTRRWKERLREEKGEGKTLASFWRRCAKADFAKSGSTGQGALYMKHNAMGVVIMAE